MEKEPMTAGEALRGLPKGSKGVDLRATTTAIATASAPFHKEGDIVEAHPLLIAKFKKEGYVK